MPATNISPWPTAPSGSGWRPSRTSVKGAVESVLDVRTAAGPFGSFFDFCRRVDLHKVNKRMLEGLIKAGAFDSTGAKRAQLMAVLDQAVEEGAAAQRERDLGQTSIFGEELNGHGSSASLPSPLLPAVAEWDQAQRLKYERELTGFYISAHPLDPLRSDAECLVDDDDREH